MFFEWYSFKTLKMGHAWRESCLQFAWRHWWVSWHELLGPAPWKWLWTLQYTRWFAIVFKTIHFQNTEHSNIFILYNCILFHYIIFLLKYITFIYCMTKLTSIFSEKISPANDGLFVLDGLFVHEGLCLCAIDLQISTFSRKIKGYKENCDR